MVSVTQRIKQVKQPRGGYISPRAFTVGDLGPSPELSIHDENIHASLVGLAVDYLTRSLISRDPISAFAVSILGARLVHQSRKAKRMARRVRDLSDKSIRTACQLSGYDVCFRAGRQGYRPVKGIKPNRQTIDHIRAMVERSFQFFGYFGPVVEFGIVFVGGYTKTVDTGDGDFVTVDTLWDFKVSSRPPTSKHTLQLLMYYLMGLRSRDRNLHRITRLGIFNPRLNKVYVLDVRDIPPDVIRAVEKNVIGYTR